MLDEIALSRSMLTSMAHETTNRVKLVIPGENSMLGAGLPSFVVLVLDDMDEMLNQVEHTVSRPDLFPEIRCGKTLPGRGISRTAVAPFVQRQEACFGTLQGRGHVDKVRINSEVG